MPPPVGRARSSLVAGAAPALINFFQGLGSQVH